jgi:hypothetical protein
LDAPQTTSTNFIQTQVVVSDPAALNRGSQPFVLQLNPGSPAQVEIAELTVAPLAERLLISQSPTNSAQVDLSWFGTSNAVYSLQTSTLAPGSSRTDLGSPVLGQGAPITVPHSFNLRQTGEFYRLHITPPAP